MPTLSRTTNIQPTTHPHWANFQQRIKKVISGRHRRLGFTLIEIVLSLFLILALISILFTASGTLIHSRSSGLQSLAAKIASRQIETLRNMSFDSLPTSGNFADSDLAKLPQGSATQTISDYGGNSDIKLVNIQISWTESDTAKQLVMDTLISENGL